MYLGRTLPSDTDPQQTMSCEVLSPFTVRCLPAGYRVLLNLTCEGFCNIPYKEYRGVRIQVGAVDTYAQYAEFNSLKTRANIWSG